MSSVLELARRDLLELTPYSHAVWEPRLERLHANELPWRGLADTTSPGLNRYPQPHPWPLVEALAELYGVVPEQVLAGRGSDEAIDLVVRGFCRAERDGVLICPPTFGMYALAARVQGAGVCEVPLLREQGFALDEAAIVQAVQRSREPDAAFRIKIVFLCSPNNPTGNLLEAASVGRICAALASTALVVVDEAYVEFAGVPSFITRLDLYPNLLVLRTLSKAFALAGARCGALIGGSTPVQFLRRLLPPYALPAPSIEAALAALRPQARAQGSSRLRLIQEERARLVEALAELAAVRRVWPSATNFLLVECHDAGRCLAAMAAAGLLVRDLRQQRGLENSLRITIGTPEQNTRLLRALEEL